MTDELSWDADSAAYIGSRSRRYPGAFDISTGWAKEVMSDVDLVMFDPDPKSRIGAIRYIGHSSSAGRVIVVIAYRDLDGDLHGINAWPASGIDMKIYEEGTGDGKDN